MEIEDLLALPEDDMIAALEDMVDAHDPLIPRILACNCDPLLYELCHILIDNPVPLQDGTLDLLRILALHDSRRIAIAALWVLVQKGGVQEWYALESRLSTERHNIGLSLLMHQGLFDEKYR